MKTIPSERVLILSKWFYLSTYFLVNFLIVFSISCIRVNDAKNQLFQFEFTFHFEILISFGLLILATIGQILLLYYALNVTFNDDNIFEIYPDDTLPKDIHLRALAFKKYSRESLVEMVEKLAKKADVIVTKVYVTINPFPNAYTISLPFKGSFININSNLLAVLPPEEAEAIIAHEIGHVKNRDSFFKLWIDSPTILLYVGGGYLFVTLAVAALNSLLIENEWGIGFIRLVILLGLLILARVFTKVTIRLLRKGERRAELLADLHAARTTDPLSVINSLIHVGQRSEALTILSDELMKMETIQRTILTPEDKQRMMRMIGTFPKAEIDEKKAQMIAPFLYLIDQLGLLREYYLVPFTDAEIASLASTAVENLVAEGIIQAQDEDPEEIKMISRDWRDFDTDESLHLDENEIFKYIDLLTRTPGKFMFSSELDADRILQTHPYFRARILNLYHNTMLKESRN